MSISNLFKGSFYRDTIVHFRNYLGAHIASKALMFISIPIMTRLLSPEEYGTYNVFVTYSGIAVVVMTLSCHTSIGRYYYESTIDFKRFMGTAVLMTAVLMCASGFLILAFSSSFAELFKLPEPLILLLPIMACIAVIDSIFQQIFQVLRESKAIAIVSTVKSYSSIALGIAFVFMYSEKRYMGLVWGQLVAGAFVSVYLVQKIKQYFSVSFDRSYAKSILVYSIPMIPYILSSIILDQFDRIMINDLRGSSDAGLYSFAYNVGMLVTVISGALYQSWMPKYFELMKQGSYDSLDNGVDRIFRIVVAFSCFLIFFGQDIGMVLAGSKFHEALWIIPVIVLGYVFHALFPIYAWSMGYALKTYWGSIIVLVSGVINIVLNSIFIPRFGYSAAAYATTASYLIMVILTWACSNYILGTHTTSPKFIMGPLAVAFSAVVAVYCVGEWEWGLTATLLVKSLFLVLCIATLVKKYFNTRLRSV